MKRFFASLRRRSLCGALLVCVGFLVTFSLAWAQMGQPTVSFMGTTLKVSETAGSGTVFVTLSNTSTNTVTVQYATADGTATSPADYTATTGTLVFSPGTTSLSFSVPIINDQITEPDETFTITLSNPTNATIGSGTMTVTITDGGGSTPYVVFSSMNYSVSEAGVSASIEVKLTSASSQTVTVHYATADGTATAGADYTATSGTLTFNPGETSKSFTVTIVDDTLVEGDETVSLTLSSPSTPAMLGTPSTATLTIIDDDQLPSVSYSPTGGPVFTEVFFFALVPGTNLFSSSTTIGIDGTFTPSPFAGEKLSISHSGAKVRFDPSVPDQVSIAVADVYPSSFLSSLNPGIAMALVGAFEGTVTIQNGSYSYTLQVAFQITESISFGKLADGAYSEISSVPVWTATVADLQDLHPSAYAYGRIERPLDQFTANPPATLDATVGAFTASGAPVSAGAGMTFTLISNGPDTLVYQSNRPFVFVDDPMVAGDYGDFVAVAGDPTGSVHIIRLPP